MRLHEWRIWGESVRGVPSGTEEDVSGNRDARATSPPRVSASGPRSIPVACGETHPVTGGSDAAFSFMVSEFRAWVAVAASRSGLRRSPRTERSCGAFRCGWRSERRRARRWRASLFGPTSNRNVRFSVLFFEKLDFKICFAPSRRDSTSRDPENVEHSPRWQTVWRDRWRTIFKPWASTPEIQTVESERDSISCRVG